MAINGRKSSNTQVATGFGFRPYLVHVVYERSTLVDYIWKYVYVC